MAILGWFWTTPSTNKTLNSTIARGNLFCRISQNQPDSLTRTGVVKFGFELKMGISYQGWRLKAVFWALCMDGTFSLLFVLDVSRRVLVILISCSIYFPVLCKLIPLFPRFILLVVIVKIMFGILWGSEIKKYIHPEKVTFPTLPHPEFNLAHDMTPKQGVYQLGNQRFIDVFISRLCVCVPFWN